MILEIAQIDVKPGMEAEFETGVKKAGPIFKRAKGCKSMNLQRSHESPRVTGCSCNGRRWKTTPKISANSADFQEWRKLVGHCFASPPHVEHVNEVVKGF